MYFAWSRAGRSSETAQTQQAWSLPKSRASIRAGTRGWPSIFSSFEIISGRNGSSESGQAEIFSAAGIRAFCLGWRFRQCKARGNLFQPLAQRFSDSGKHLRAGFSKPFFGRRRNSRNQVARLVVQRSHGRQHPLVRNIFELALVMFHGLLADLAVGALHFFLMRVRHGLPGSQQRLESFFYFFARVRHACLERAAHRRLEPAEEFLLLGGHAVRELFSRGVHLRPRLFL